MAWFLLRAAPVHRQRRNRIQPAHLSNTRRAAISRSPPLGRAQRRTQATAPRRPPVVPPAPAAAGAHRQQKPPAGRPYPTALNSQAARRYRARVRSPPRRKTPHIRPCPAQGAPARDSTGVLLPPARRVLPSGITPSSTTSRRNSAYQVSAGTAPRRALPQTAAEMGRSARPLATIAGRRG